MPLSEFDPLLVIAREQIPSTCPNRPLAVGALMAAARDTATPALALDSRQITCLRGKLAALGAAGTLAMNEALLVSLLLVKRESSWDPERLPTVRQASKVPETYLAIRNALGVLALAWQLRERPDALVLTRDALVTHINQKASSL